MILHLGSPDVRDRSHWEIRLHRHLAAGEKVKLFTSDRRHPLHASTALPDRELPQRTAFRRALFSSPRCDSPDRCVGHRCQPQLEFGKRQVGFHGDASGSLGFFSVSADTNARGSHSASSTSDFLRQMHTHATASANQSVQATHAAASVSIGEVSTRTHVQTESEDHFESSSREFSNANRCHAVTFFFYRLNKKQIVKITLEAIERRVDDPAAPTRVSSNPSLSKGQISVVPTSVLATQKDRAAVEQVGRDSVAAQERYAFGASTAVGPAPSRRA